MTTKVKVRICRGFVRGTVVSIAASLLASCSAPATITIDQLLAEADAPTTPGVYVVSNELKFEKLKSDDFNWAGSLSLDAGTNDLGPGFVADPDDSVYYGECFGFAESLILTIDPDEMFGILIVDLAASPTPTIPDPRPDGREGVVCSANYSQLSGMRFEKNTTAKLYGVEKPSELPQMLSIQTSGSLYEKQVWLVNFN